MIKIRHRRTDDDNSPWETITGHDGKPARILKDGRRVRVPAYLRDEGQGADCKLVVEEERIG
jgi:hypothetical protein